MTDVGMRGGLTKGSRDGDHAEGGVKLEREDEDVDPC